MRKLLKRYAKKKHNGKKKIIMRPIEEDEDKQYVSNWAYKSVFQRCRDDLKFMRIGKDTDKQFYKSPAQLRNVLKCIQEAKNLLNANKGLN